MKIGKEIKINKHKNYKVRYGCVNNKKPKAIYITISAWGEPTDKDVVSYTRIIKDINKKIKQSLYKLLGSDSLFYANRNIIDLDIRESGIKYGKRSYINCEITLFLKEEIPVNSDVMGYASNDIITTIINDVFDKNKKFIFHKRKS